MSALGRGVLDWPRPIVSPPSPRPFTRAWLRSFLLREETNQTPGLPGEPRGRFRWNPRGGTKPKGASGGVLVATSDGATDSDVEQNLEVGWPERRNVSAAATSDVRDSGAAGTTRRYQVAVMRHGCSRGKSFEGSGATGEGPEQPHPLGVSGSGPETWRTPWLAVSCNIPTGCRCGVNRRSREERQGRNEFERWQFRAEGRMTSCRSLGREWTRGTHVNGGAIFEIHGELLE